jgi:subtilisin
MRYRRYLIASPLLLLLALLTLGSLWNPRAPLSAEANSPGPSNGSINPVINGRFIVVLRRDGNAPDRVAQLEQRLGFRADHVYRYALQGFAAQLPDAAVNVLRSDPNVVLVQPDRVVQVSDTLPTGVDRIDADKNSTAAIDGSGPDLAVNVAVIDTGVGPHPDLRINSEGFSEYALCDIFCQLGLLPISCGNTGSFNDEFGHGTHVAGTIAARDNGLGVVGVAPGALIWSVRVLGPEGYGCDSDVIAGMDWVTARAGTIAVANMSLGGQCGGIYGPCGNSSAQCTALNNSVNLGVVYAVAAGNSSANAANFVPASCPSAITVSAIADYNGKAGGGAAATCANYGADDSFASFSNYGSIVDIAAPGVCILSTVPTGTCTMCDPSGYASASGTSMATPHVSGAAALDVVVNGKPVNATGVSAVLSRMLANAFPQSSSCGFTGDPDSSHEPLLNVGPLCGATTNTPTPTPTGTTASPTPTPTPTSTPAAFCPPGQHRKGVC